MNDSNSDKVFCSDLSLQAGESLEATATPTSEFLLIEFNGAWGEKAYEESPLSPELKAHLNAYANNRSGCKILLIRSPRSLAEPGVRFFAAQVEEAGSQVFDFHFEEHDEILGLDLPAVFAGQYPAHRRTAPLYLVCAHGRRDRCCSRLGIPVFNALLDTARQDDAGIGVWQSSHVGGHRFAANLICLSSGLLYGRVTPSDVGAILAAERRGEMRLENVRGRLAYTQPVQAAEMALRNHIGEIGLRTLHLDAFEQVAPSSWVVDFFHVDGRSFQVQVQAEKTGAAIYESCTMEKTTALVKFNTQLAV